MKTKEFIKKVKSLGFEIRTEYGRKAEPVEFRIRDDEQTRFKLVQGDYEVEVKK